MVIPKAHYPSYAFALPDDALSALMLATKKTANLLDRALLDVGRTAMVFEGFGVDHVHAKLYPMHGTADMERWKPIESSVPKYFEQYEGYISSHDYERADDAALAGAEDLHVHQLQAVRLGDLGREPRYVLHQIQRDLLE